MTEKTPHILVTGSTRGIGAAIVEALSAKGARVTGHGRADAKDVVGADLALPGSADALWDAALARLDGRIDVLVNNAGIGPENLAENVNEADFDATLAVNLKGTFFAAQAAGRRMIARKSGRIINMSSQAGQVAHQLHVGEVARRQRIWVAAPVQAEALDRPGSDLADLEKTPVAAGIVEVSAPASDLPRAAHHRHRPPLAQVHRGELGRRPAGDHGRGRHVAKRPGIASGPRWRMVGRKVARGPASNDPALDRRGPRALDQLLGDRPAERLPGPGPAPRPYPGPLMNRGAKERVALEGLVEVTHLLLHSQREPDPLDRDVQLGFARLSDVVRDEMGHLVRMINDSGIDRLRADVDEAIPGLPGPGPQRRPVDVHEALEHPPTGAGDSVAARRATEPIGPAGHHPLLDDHAQRPRT